MSTTSNLFPNTTSPTNPLKTIAATSTKLSQTSTAVAKSKPKPVTVSAITTRGPRYTITVDFSDDDGDTFDSPLKPVSGAAYQIRALFTQLQAEPLIQGVELVWYLPAGWRFVDGFGSRTFDTCVSNPLHLSRVIRAPTTIVKAGFKVLCVKVY